MPLRFNRFWLALFGLLLLSCRSEPESKSAFVHEIADGPKPWTSEDFEDTEHDITFAIIADLTGGERDGVYSRAVRQLNRLDPTFVLSVGDLIEGGTVDTLQLKTEWDDFDARTARLKMPFFYIGGNHDLTHPVMRTYWESRLGPRYYHFRYQDMLFLMLDSEDFEDPRMIEIYHARDTASMMLRGEMEGNFEESTYFKMPERSTGAIRKEQQDYFIDVLARHTDVKWTFVLMHKPLWKRLDDKGLGRLESFLQNRPYTVINGHEHSISHQVRHGRDYIILGTTGGYQRPGDSLAIDHITLVRMEGKPIITHLKMDGVRQMDGSFTE